MRLIKDLLIYVVPFALIVGTNFDLSNLIGINIAIGYSEFIIFLLLIFLVIDNKIIFPRKLIFAFLLSLFSIILSLFFSSKPISQISIIELIRWIEYFILFVSIYSLANKNNIKKSFYSLIMASIWFISVAIYQVFTFNFYEKRIYGTFLSAADIAQESISNPNVAGAFLVGCFLFIYSFKHYTNNWKRKLLILLQYICFILVLYTLSRSAFIGMILGFLTLIYFIKKNIKIILIRISIVILFIAIIFSKFISNIDDFVIFQRAVNTFDTSTNSGASVTARFENSSKTIDIGLDNIFFGIGFGDLENQFNVVPDNYYFHIFAETGIVGFITSIILLIVIFYDLLIMKKNKDDEYFFYINIAFIAFYISFLFENYAANLFRNPRLLGLFWFSLALIYKYHLIISKKSNPLIKINE